MKPLKSIMGTGYMWPEFDLTWMWDKAKKGRCRRGKWEDPKIAINHVGLKHWSTWTVRACKKMLKAKYSWTSKWDHEGSTYGKACSIHLFWGSSCPWSSAWWWTWSHLCLMGPAIRKTRWTQVGRRVKTNWSLLLLCCSSVQLLSSFPQ